jgi:hypothetical protein
MPEQMVFYVTPDQASTLLRGNENTSGKRNFLRSEKRRFVSEVSRKLLPPSDNSEISRFAGESSAEIRMPSALQPLSKRKRISEGLLPDGETPFFREELDDPVRIGHHDADIVTKLVLAFVGILASAAVLPSNFLQLHSSHRRIGVNNRPTQSRQHVHNE